MRAPNIWALVLLWGTQWMHLTAASVDDILSHYDTLHHRDIIHHVHKRSIDSSERRYERRISLNLNTLGKHLDLQLVSDPSLFDLNFEAVTIDGQGHKQKVDLDTTDFYTGYVEGDEKSSISVHFEDDNLVARIHTKDDVIAIEPSYNHLPESDDYTMIAYRISDVKDLQNKSSRAFCGYVHPDHDDAAYETLKKNHHVPNVETKGPPTPAEKLRQLHQSSSAKSSDKARHKRQASSKTKCTITLVGDKTFYDTVGFGNEQTAVRYMVGAIAAVNTIFTRTDFTLDNVADDYGMSIAGAIIHTTYNEDSSHYNADKAWSTDELLNAFSAEDWSSSCLAHLFTARPFNGGILGLAWVASSDSGYAGGICSTPGLSYNTGWTSLKDASNNRLSSLQSDIVTTHEIGHNWGSNHDPDSCAPSSHNGGKYIMYQYAVDGNNENNDKFSICSRQTINAVLQTKQDSCFFDPAGPVCGNFVLEDGEECDAGGGFGDPCCRSNCLLQRRKDCSDYNYACCVDCEAADSSVVCRESSTNPYSCLQEAKCNGGDFDVCPASANKPDGTACGDNGACREGSCLSYCGIYNAVDCLCENDEDACYHCCIVDNVCQKYPANSTVLAEGKSCVKGYCNAVGVCETNISTTDFRDWFIITDFTPDNILIFMRNNIVLAVIVLSLIAYAPFVIIVLCVDYHRQKELEKDKEFKSEENNDFVRDVSNKGLIEPAYARRRRGGNISSRS